MISLNKPRLAIFIHWNNGKGIKGNLVKFILTSKIFKDNLCSVLSDVNDPVLGHSAWAVNHANKIQCHGV